jgi:hypothetical protein
MSEFTTISMDKRLELFDQGLALLQESGFGMSFTNQVIHTVPSPISPSASMAALTPGQQLPSIPVPPPPVKVTPAVTMPLPGQPPLNSVQAVGMILEQRLQTMEALLAAVVERLNVLAGVPVLSAPKGLVSELTEKTVTVAPPLEAAPVAPTSAEVEDAECAICGNDLDWHDNCKCACGFHNECCSYFAHDFSERGKPLICPTCKGLAEETFNSIFHGAHR